jgi:glycosyltransferase involved in cell wall biosynthesis
MKRSDLPKDSAGLAIRAIDRTEDAGMDARNRGTATRGEFGTADTVATLHRRLVRDRGPAPELDLPPQLAGLRVALVHDWLTGMRGGEKCLEVLCRAFPEAELYTLIHRQGSLSLAIESMKIRTSPLQLIPGVFRHYRQLLPIMPLAARAWRLKDVDLVISLSHCVAKAVVLPPGIPHVCYCFTPMRYAWQGRETYLESWSDRPVRRALARTMLSRLRSWDFETASRVTHFVAISETIRERIAQCYARESRVIQPPVNVNFYSPIPRVPRDDFYLVVSALVPYKRIDQAVAACAQSGRQLIVIGEGPERARLEAMAGTTVRFLGWQRDQVIGDYYRSCRALLFPGEEDFGIVPMEALACGAPVIALGRGGVAETVDDAVGRIYAEPTSDGLLAAIDDWESEGCPHDPTEARSRAEALSVPVFRDRILKFLAEVVTGDSQHVVPPAPHLRELNRQEAGSKTGRIEERY